MKRNILVVCMVTIGAVAIVGYAAQGTAASNAPQQQSFKTEEKSIWQKVKDFFFKKSVTEEALKTAFSKVLNTDNNSIIHAEDFPAMTTLTPIIAHAPHQKPLSTFFQNIGKSLTGLYDVMEKDGVVKNGKINVATIPQEEKAHWKSELTQFGAFVNRQLKNLFQSVADLSNNDDEDIMGYAIKVGEKLTADANKIAETLNSSGKSLFQRIKESFKK